VESSYVVPEESFSKETDIYSLGILFWELSNGYSQFEAYENENLLATSICQELEKTIIENTPSDYHKLYTNCWNKDPNERPIIEDVYDKLKCMLHKNNETIEEKVETEGSLMLIFNKIINKSIEDILNHYFLGLVSSSVTMVIDWNKVGLKDTKGNNFL
jgi:serine/threonine protein kinase